jgi:hypothetical protein
MSKENYMSLYYDSLSRTATILEGLMDSLDDTVDPEAEILACFSKVNLDKKQSVDDRAATIRSLATCEKDLAAHKEIIGVKLRQLKSIQKKLKQDTLDTLGRFKNQPFRGKFCQLQANNTRGRIETDLNLTNMNISNTISEDEYASTDIPEDCFGKMTYHYLKKDVLYSKLKGGLEIQDARIAQGKSLKIKDLV